MPENRLQLYPGEEIPGVFANQMDHVQCLLPEQIENLVIALVLLLQPPPGALTHHEEEGLHFSILL
jgi:hypothetical protein